MDSFQESGNEVRPTKFYTLGEPRGFFPAYPAKTAKIGRLANRAVDLARPAR